MSKQRAAGIPVRDTILWVEDTGESHLPPVFCLHSLFLDGAMFDRLVEVARGRFRIIRPDFRGQGSSAPATAEIIDMDTCAQDMLALIEAMGLASVHLVAASMGGDVAVRMAARRPDLIRSLAVTGSSVRAEPVEQLERFREFLKTTEGPGFTGEHLDVLVSVMFGETTRSNPEAAEMVAHWRTKMSLLPRSRWAAMRGVVERESAVPLLAGISVPTLVLSGAEDVARPTDWGQEVATGIEGARFLVLDGVGHSPILEAPAEVIPGIIAFIEEAEQQGRRPADRRSAVTA